MNFCKLTCRFCGEPAKEHSSRIFMCNVVKELFESNLIADSFCKDCFLCLGPHPTFNEYLKNNAFFKFIYLFICLFACLFIYFNTVSSYVAWTGLKRAIFLPQPPRAGIIVCGILSSQNTTTNYFTE
jgi:hypothetical protein